MIICDSNLNQRMSIDTQNKEISRIKNAPVGTILFTAGTSSNTDVIETLLHKSGIHYCELVANYTVQYRKESPNKY